MSELIVYNPSQTSAPPRDSARRPIMLGLFVMLAFFGGIGGWAAVAPLNGAVVAPGVIKVEGNRKTIQHLDGGIVKQLLIKEGSHVEAGQTVIVLEDTQARAARDVLAQQHDLLRAQEARLLTQRDGNDHLVFPDDLVRRRGDPDVDKLLATEQRQFDIARTALEGQIAVIGQRIRQYEEQIIGLQAEQASVNQQIDIIKGQLQDEHYLLNRGLTQRPRVLELERQAAALHGQAGEIVAGLARARQAIGELNTQIIQVRSDRNADVAKDLREVEGKIADVAPRLQAAQDVLDRTEIRSPYAGRVVDLAVFSVGGVIQRGDKVMDIVPLRDGLVVEAQVGVNDIDDVHPDTPAEVHFLAYKQRILPVIHGRVTEVSADRLTDKRTGQPYYTAQIAVDGTELAASDQIHLYPGMAATAMIMTKERTALDYLLGPMFAAFDQSLREK